MSKMGAYQPTEKFKNYLLPTSKPLRSHSSYEEKVWTVQERIYKKLKEIAEFLESLYPKLTDDFSGNIRNIIEKNLETLIQDLDLMQRSLLKNPNTFNTNKLKTNQHCITEMKNVCSTLQTVRSYELESKKLGKMKHALHELELLIQPTSFEMSLEKARVRKPKALPAKKERISVGAKKIKRAISGSKTPKAISKKAKPKTKLLKPIKIGSKQLQKSKTPIRKQSGKKVAKPKLPAKHKKVSTAKPKSRIKLAAARKK